MPRAPTWPSVDRMDSWEIARNRIVVSLLWAFVLLPLFVAAGFLAAGAFENATAGAPLSVVWFVACAAFFFGWPVTLTAVVLLSLRRIDRAFADFCATLFGLAVIVVATPLADIPGVVVLPLAGVVLVIAAAPCIVHALR